MEKTSKVCDGSCHDYEENCGQTEQKLLILMAQVKLQLDNDEKLINVLVQKNGSCLRIILRVV